MAGRTTPAARPGQAGGGTQWFEQVPQLLVMTPQQSVMAQGAFWVATEPHGKQPRSTVQVVHPSAGSGADWTSGVKSGAASRAKTAESAGMPVQAPGAASAVAGASGAAATAWAPKATADSTSAQAAAVKAFLSMCLPFLPGSCAEVAAHFSAEERAGRWRSGQRSATFSNRSTISASEGGRRMLVAANDSACG